MDKTQFFLQNVRTNRRSTFILKRFETLIQIFFKLPTFFSFLLVIYTTQKVDLTK